MGVFKPIRIFWQNGVIRPQTELMIWAAQYVLNLAGVSQKIKVEYGSGYILEAYKDTDPDNIFFDHIYVNWLIEAVLRGQSQNCEGFYFLIGVEDSIFGNDGEGIGSFVGFAYFGGGGIVNVGRPANLDNPNFRKRVIVVTMHELAHVFNLKHCDNCKCVMNKDIPTKEVDIEKGPFCPLCLRDLRAYFKNSV